MPTRYTVRAVDRSGNPIRREVVADSIAHAEQLAVEDGLEVRGISVAQDPPAGKGAREPDPADSAQAGGEQTLWEGQPSHWANLWVYVAAILVITIPWSFWSWLSLRSTRITLTSQRLRIKTGVLSTHVEELELYRVRDSSLAQTFWQRLVGVGDVVLDTTDVSTPRLSLRHLVNPSQVRETLRAQVERVRRVQKVREIEMS